MPDIKILSEADLRDLVPLDLAAVDCVEQGFAALASGAVEMPPILSLGVHENNGEVDVKTAHITGAPSFTIKMSPGFYDNPKLGLPTTNGIMVVFSAHTGQVEAVLLDNGYLTEVRTAAAGAVAARHLAKPDASRVCIVGAGAQARLQLEAINLVRPIKHASIWARDPEKAMQAAKDIHGRTGAETSVAGDLAEAIADADIVVTTTPAKEPFVMPGWLRPGQLVIAMGSDQEGKCELDPGCIVKADHYIPDRLSQTRVLGELRPAVDKGLVAVDAEFPELGHVVAGEFKAFDPASNLIICDLTGTGVQDTAIATFARQRAEAAGKGAAFTS